MNYGLKNFKDIKANNWEFEVLDIYVVMCNPPPPAS